MSRIESEIMSAINLRRRRASLSIFTMLVLLALSGSLLTAQEKDKAIGPPATKPTATPTPEGPTPEDLRRAAEAGRADGRADGSREGISLGAREGAERGRREGEQRGFRRCQDNERERAGQRGYQEGLRYGARLGDEEGERAGRGEGERRGQNDGDAGGLSKAGEDARQSEAGPGAASGIKEAEAGSQSVTARAAREGAQAGDNEAAGRARSFDYERGRTAYREEQFQQTPRFSDTFSFTGETRTSPVSRFFVITDDADLWLYVPHDGAAQFSHGVLAAGYQEKPQEPEMTVPEPETSTPAYSNQRTPPGFATEEERAAYNNAYRTAYQESWREAYHTEFRRAYRADYRYAYDSGCDEARRRNYDGDYHDGEQRGTEEARRRQYDISFRSASETAYRVAYRQAYDTAYAGELPRARSRAFEQARADAYAQRTQEIYDAAFARARQARYDATYPRYQTQEYERGRAVEAADFASRPLRLTATTITETRPDGVVEPGEELRLQIDLRNFGNTPIRREDFTIVAENSGDSSPQQAQIKWARDLRPASRSAMSDALAFYLPETALREDYEVRLKLLYQGRAIDEKTIPLRARYAVEMNLGGDSQLAEGLPRILRVELTNRSTRPTPADARVVLQKAGDIVELPVPEAALGELAPGAVRVVEFPLVARSYEQHISVPLDIRIEAPSRRLGRAVTELSFPVNNAYKVNISSDLKELHQVGASRVAYQITRHTPENNEARALQVSLRIVGDNADAFVWPGPPAQYLAPLRPGAVTNFVAPVQITRANEGGTLEITVLEEGQAVVVRRVKF